MKKAFLIVAATGLIAGCGTMQEPEPVYPSHPTAMVRATYVIHWAWLPTTRGEQLVFTRTDRRAIIYGRGFTDVPGERLFKEAKDFQIGRVDKNLAWYVDNKRKTYRQCPLSGCPMPAVLRALSGEYGEEVDGPESKRADCVTTLVENSFKVQETGKKQTVNDFPAQEYVATWKLVSQDQARRKDVSTVTFTFWATPETPAIQEVLRIHEEFQRGYFALNKEHDSPLARILPQDVYLQIAAFGGDIAKQATQSSNQFAREMKKIKGYPVSIRTVWRLDNKACPQEDTAAAQKPEPALDFTGRSSFLSSLLERARHRADETASRTLQEKMEARSREKPMLDYTYEIIRVDIRDISDGIFELPRGYKPEEDRRRGRRRRG